MMKPVAKKASVALYRNCVTVMIMVEGLESGVVAGIVAGVLMLALAVLTTGVTVVVVLYCKNRQTLKHKGRDKGIIVARHIFYRVYFDIIRNMHGTS